MEDFKLPSNEKLGRSGRLMTYHVSILKATATAAAAAEDTANHFESALA